MPRFFPTKSQSYKYLLWQYVSGNIMMASPYKPGLWVTISSGTLFWIMLFRILMPGIKGTVQLRFQTSFLVYILTPLAIQFAKGVELGWCRFEPTVLVFLGQQVLPETITGTNWISPDEGSSYYNSSLLDQMKVQTNETKYMLFLLRINF